MKIIRKIVSAVMVICMVASMMPVYAAEAGTYAIASVTSQVGEAIVRFTASGDCLVAVAAYDGDGRMVSINSVMAEGAKGYQSVSVPVTVDEDEYDLKAFLMDSVTHEPLCGSYTIKNAVSAGVNYAIMSLEGHSGEITSVVNTDDTCALEVQIWDQSETTLIYQESAKISGGLQLDEVSVNGPVYLPEYYIMRAVMRDEEGNAISNPFLNRSHTEAAERFEALTELDYGDRTDVTVVDIGEFDDGNFMVLNENVTLIDSFSDINYVVSDSDGVLIFRNPNYYLKNCSAGDLICYTDPDGHYSTAKIKSISVDGTEVVITKDDNVSLGDFYDVIKLDLDFEYKAEDSGSGSGGRSAAVSDEIANVKFGPELSYGLETVIGGVNVNGQVGGNVKITYAPEIYGEKYMELVCVAAVKGEVEVFIGYNGSYREDYEIARVPIVGVLKEIGDVALELALVYDIDCKIGLDMVMGFEQSYGIVYNSDTGLQQAHRKLAEQKSATSDSDLKAEAEIELGVRGGVEAQLFDEMISASLGGEIGLAIDGEIEIVEGALVEGLDSYHACGMCMNGSFKTYAELDFVVDYDINWFLKGKLMDLDFVRIEGSIYNFYASMRNETASPFGGLPAFGLADNCPNSKYKVTFHTFDADGNETEGQTVTVTGVDNDYSGVFMSPEYGYFYPGTYKASSLIGENTAEITFTVTDSKRVVYLIGGDNILSGVVSNIYGGAVLDNVTVNLVKDGKIVSETMTDAEGFYTMEVPDGDYRVSFVREGYESKIIELQILEDKALDAQLQSVVYTVSFDSNGGSGVTPPVTFRYGQAATLPKCTFEAPEGKKFAGWDVGDYILDEGVGYTFDEGDQVVPAKWRNNYHIVTVTALYEDGTAASGLTVEGTGLDIEPVTGADGKVSFELTDGSYRLSVMDTSKNNDYVEMEIIEDTEITLTLKAPQVTWYIDEVNQVLYINGDGPMPDYMYRDSAPWHDQRENIKSAVLTGVTTVGRLAFGECGWMETVSIPEGVTEIGYGAFWACGALTDVTIPDGVTTIDGAAFYNCYTLTADSVHIPESVTSIGSGAFEGCESLEKLPYLGSITMISDDMFYECTGLKEVVIPEGITYIGLDAFYNSYEIVKVVCPDSLRLINTRAFSGVSNLTELSLNDGLEQIGAEAFEGCFKLESVIIPDSVNLIGGETFRDCTGLKKAVLPSEITMIYGGLFQDCTSLEEVNIPEGVTEIQTYAFSGCESLKNIDLPNGLTTLGMYAFMGSGFAELTVPGSLTSIADYAFAICPNLTDVVIEEGVPYLSLGMFTGCSSLKSVVILSSVTKVYNYVFESCTALTDVYYAGTQEEWEAMAVTLPETATVHYNYTSAE